MKDFDPVIGYPVPRRQVRAVPRDMVPPQPCPFCHRHNVKLDDTCPGCGTVVKFTPKRRSKNRYVRLGKMATRVADQKYHGTSVPFDV